MANGHLKRIVVYGGGRWARTLVAVLRRVMPGDSEIVWVTKHCFADAQSWLLQNPTPNLCLVSEWDLATEVPDAVIVATSPPSQFELVLDAVTLRVPTLCEKPLVSDSTQLSQLLSLADGSRCLIGVHLEFLFASYLRDFALQIESASIRSIHLDWLDPWSEERDGETKHAEFYTDIVSDQLPHCWSVLATIRPVSSRLILTNVSYSPDFVELQGYFGVSAVTLRLSRRASHRVRRVSVTDDHGFETVLDFSVEPGSITIGDQQILNRWSGGRPLACSLSSFVDAVRYRDQSPCWPMELKNCLDSVLSSLRARDMLQVVLDEHIDTLLTSECFCLDNSEHVNLVVDRFLPEFAAQGRRFCVDTWIQQQSFASLWLSSIR